MSNRLARLNRALLELRRRHVFRMAGGYMVVAWVFLQVADILLPAFMAPDWVMSILVVLAVMGMPVVVVLTWLYDLTPQGIERTLPDHTGSATASGRSWNWRWIDYLIIAVLATILLVVLAREDSSGPAQGSEARTGSVAVLPFADLSPQGDQRYFSDGLSEALMDGLANIPGLQVAARTSSFTFRETKQDAPSVARALNVDALLEGSVRKSGEQLRISVRLIDGSSGRRLWNETFAATADDIFVLQDSIARAVATSFEIRHLGDLESVLTPTHSQAAYDQYLQGRGQLRQASTAEGIDGALAHFKQALEIDPDFMLASAGLCQAHWMKYTATLESEQAQAAFSACNRAESQNPDHIETLVALGQLYRGTGEIDRSFEKLRQALDIAPNDEQVHAALGETHRVAGQMEEAEQSFRTAIRLDPAYWRNYWALGRVLAETGRLEEAADFVRRAIELEPENAAAWSTLGGIYFYQSEFIQAADAFRQSIGSHPTPQAYANAGTQYFYGGDFTRARAMFEQAVSLSPADFRYHGFLAECILLEDGGGLDAARPHFERAVELARETLAINAEDPLTRAALAAYLATLGELADAQQQLERLEADPSTDMRALHTMGMARLVMGQTDRALAHFHAAMELGYPQRMLQSDPRTRALFGQPAENPVAESTQTQ
ncbi:tetratricopeptide repeat protein [Wenzhouxiangella sp. XN201]|uniref:tetratricopeptide repeat protein n=1 Tax=Wenzhouxiangella sp. XN201 TaxID=2710755 RepID=UPI0013C5CCA5|nr:tetratricopeptide repeat protein [Wenzhouxiangella sp. XN201]NEZ05082.1 tetratricopeptide repeat protein [Wenzhouxiangella sp. XN201]